MDEFNTWRVDCMELVKYNNQQLGRVWVFNRKEFEYKSTNWTCRFFIFELTNDYYVIHQIKSHAPLNHLKYRPNSSWVSPTGATHFTGACFIGWHSGENALQFCTVESSVVQVFRYVECEMLEEIKGCGAEESAGHSWRQRKLELKSKCSSDSKVEHIATQFKCGADVLFFKWLLQEDCFANFWQFEKAQEKYRFDLNSYFIWYRALL